MLIWRTVVVGVALAGVACALTLLYLGMRAVMDVGGFCASGGAYEIRQECPQGIPAVMVGSIWGGLVFAGIYAWQVFRHGIPNFVSLLWSALFLSLGWNFLDYAFTSSLSDGVVWGWLICGVVFVLMGALPLLAVLPWTVRQFTRDDVERPPGWPAGMPLGHMQRVAARVQPAAAADDRLVEGLERLARLHGQGALSDEEYDAAKRELLRGRW